MTRLTTQNRLLARWLVALGATLGAGISAHGETVVVHDHFDDGALGPAWVVEFREIASGWVHEESGTELIVTEIGSNTLYHSWGSRSDFPWAEVTLTQSITPLTDFHAECALSWDSEGRNDAIQEVYLRLLDGDGANVATLAYYDAWVLFRGEKAAWLGAGALADYVSGTGSLTFSGSALLEIGRVGGSVTVSWDGVPLYTETVTTPVEQVQIHFGHFPYSGAEGTSSFGSESVDYVRVVGETDMVSVSADIKPGSCPNSVNPKSKGVLPAAVCGTEVFDVTTIDPTTVVLGREGVDGTVVPLRWSLEDVATPYEGEPGGGHNLGADGITDLTLKFRNREVFEALGLDAAGMVEATISGQLTDGTAFAGTDWLRVLFPGDANGDGIVDLQDYAVLKGNFGQAGGLFEGDFNEDGVVDMQDFGILKEFFGQGASAAATVPEPATLMLLGAGGVLVLARRQRR